MPQFIVKRIPVALASLVIAAVPAVAHAAENSQVISGNGWVALGVIGLLVGIVVMAIRGTIHIEDRHARMHGWRRDSGHGWFGFPDDDDDDGDDAPG